MRAQAGPGERATFKSKRDCDGIAVEFGGNGERSEGDGQAKIEKTGQRRAGGTGIGQEARDREVASGKKEKEKSERPTVGGPQQGVERGGIDHSVGHDEEKVHVREIDVVEGAQRGARGIEKKEEAGEDDGAFEEKSAMVERIVPLPKVEMRTHKN